METKEENILKFKLLDKDCMPFKKYGTDAGYDLRSRESVIVRPGRGSQDRRRGGRGDTGGVCRRYKTPVQH